MEDFLGFSFLVLQPKVVFCSCSSEGKQSITLGLERQSKNGRPATPPVEKKQSCLLALYSKDEIPTLSRKVYFSVLSDVAAKDKSPASLLLRNIFFHETSGILLADSRQRARCIIAAKTQSAGLWVLSFPFHGIGLGINAAPDVIERKICFALQRYCFIFKEKRVNKK